MHFFSHFLKFEIDVRVLNSFFFLFVFLLLKGALSFFAKFGLTVLIVLAIYLLETLYELSAYATACVTVSTSTVS